MSWPADADGDVLRRMQRAAFDFSRPAAIDFNIDFDQWPPSREALTIVHANWGEPELHPPMNGERGYVQFVVRAIVTYQLVADTQRKATSLLAPFGGRCDSWGVLQDAKPSGAM